MTRPLSSDAIPANAPDTFHELDLEQVPASTYFKIGSHWFMAQRVNIRTATYGRPSRPDKDPIRDLDEIDMTLVHAHWRGCDD